MKKCLNCNLEFDDNSTFCPKCGQKLVSKNVCPKCGKPIEPSDAFCRHCGAKLEKVVFCPKCQTTCPPDSEFCPKCGTKTVNGLVTRGHCHVETRNAVNSPVRKAFAIVALVLSSVACLLLLIGVFGDFFTKTSTIGVSKSYGISYFFKEGIETVKASFWGSNKDYFKFMLTSFVIENILFFGGLVSCLVLVGISIKKNITSFAKGNKFNFKLLKTAGVLAMIHPVYWMATKYTRISYGTIVAENSKFGWGAILLIVGISALILADIFNDVMDSVEKKESWPNFVFNHTISLLLLLVLTIGFAKTVGVSQGTVTINFQSYYVLTNVFATSSSTGFFNAQLFGLSMGGFLMSLFTLAIIAILWILGKKINKIVGIILSSILLGVVIANMVLSSQATLKYYSTTSNYLVIGAGITFALVTSIVLIGIYICQLVIKLNQKQRVNIA